MPDLLFLLFLGHYLGDFAFQSDWMANNKKTSIWALSLHVTIYTLIIGGCLWVGLILINSSEFFQLQTVFVLSFLYVEHWLQDYLKGRILSCGRQAFYLDQALHIVILYFIRIVIYHG